MKYIQVNEYQDRFGALLCLCGIAGVHYITYATYAELQRRAGQPGIYRNPN